MLSAISKRNEMMNISKSDIENVVAFNALAGSFRLQASPPLPNIYLLILFATVYVIYLFFLLILLPILLLTFIIFEQFFIIR